MFRARPLNKMPTLWQLRRMLQRLRALLNRFPDTDWRYSPVNGLTERRHNGRIERRSPTPQERYNGERQPLPDYGPIW